MKLSKSVKSISYFKTHAAEIIQNITENHETMVITQNGEAKAVVQDIHTYEKIEESIALLKMLALSKKSLESGNVRPASEVLHDLKKQIEKDQKQ